MSWSCKKCTFLNPPSRKSECLICLSSNPSSSSLLNTSSSSPKWSCKACTFLNTYKNSVCEVCATRCPVLSLSTVDYLSEILLDAENDSSVGSVFFPLLRPCKRKASDYDSSEPEPSRHGKTKASDDDLIDITDDHEHVSAAENVDSGKRFGSLKIMSYNVWFREDLELQKRMKAIGDLVQLHSPDVICFQELSKLPVKSFINEPFRNSVMGRELCIGEVEAVGGKSLVVATSHLESPCPAPPKWDQMYSKERVEQANEAVNLLKKYPNAIFAGDMNWDDKLDGEYPLPDGWIDAWSVLRPKETGWTYDTKSNQMLTGNRTLQKRLDRFICCFHDLKISAIDMIGMDAIPGVIYCKEKKVRKEIKQLVLPVLPSDHYGLLLTVCSK